MDRVKESLFGSIQNYIRDSAVLDLFAGSGSLGIEALSNGAKYVLFNDLNIKCTLSIKENLKKFNINDRADVFTMDYKKCLSYILDNKKKFDLIFLDPPYKNRNLNDVAKFIYDNDILNEDGLIIFEVNELYIDLDYYEKIKSKKYGDKFIVIYKNRK